MVWYQYRVAGFRTDFPTSRFGVFPHLLITSRPLTVLALQQKQATTSYRSLTCYCPSPEVLQLPRDQEKLFDISTLIKIRMSTYPEERGRFDRLGLKDCEDLYRVFSTGSPTWTIAFFTRRQLLPLFFKKPPTSMLYLNEVFVSSK